MSMLLLMQAIWENIWKFTTEKSQTNATNVAAIYQSSSTDVWSMPPQHVRGIRRPCGTSPHSCPVPMSDHCVVHLASTLCYHALPQYTLYVCRRRNIYFVTVNFNCLFFVCQVFFKYHQSLSHWITQGQGWSRHQNHTSQVLFRYHHSPRSHQSSHC